MKIKEACPLISARINASLVALGQSLPLDTVVGNREGRIEPRANKRRPKILKLMTIPRATYQAQILTAKSGDVEIDGGFDNDTVAS